MKKYLCHFLMLNVVVVAVGWMLTNDFPECVFVSAETQPGLVVGTDCGRGCRLDGNVTKHFWLPDGFFQGDLRLTRRAGKESAKLTEVRVWSRGVFERRWTNPKDLAFGADGTVTLRASAATFGLSRVGWAALAGGEIGLLVLAGIFCLIGRNMCRMKVRPSSDTCAVVVAVAVAVFCGGIVPLQTLLANQAELGLAVGPVLLALSWRVALLAIALAALLCWSTRFAGALYLILASAFLVYEYLETGILTIGCPSLNGDMTFYKDLTRMAWDALVFPAAFVGLFVLYRFFPRSLPFVPCAVCLLGFSSLLDVRSNKPELRSELGVELINKRQVVRDAVYSKNKNVLVYVLDSTATPYLKELFRLNPAFADELTGFTFYANNLGMFDGTVMSVAGMTTGKYYDDVSKSVEYMYRVYSKESLLAKYLEGGSAVFFSPGSFDVGIAEGGEGEKKIGQESRSTADGSCSDCGGGAWRGGEGEKKIGQESRSTADGSCSDCGVLEKRMNGQQPWTLPEIARFRLMPFAAKYLNSFFTSAAWSSIGDAEYEPWAYPILAKAPVLDIPLSLQWFHTMGMHVPYGISRTGVDDGLVKSGDEAKVNKLWFVWSQLVELFRQLKARGLYDSSTIVITADHGCDTEADKEHAKDETYLPMRAYPVLLVKPPSATGAMRVSDLPTSHARICELVLRAREEQLTPQAIDGILRCENRYFCLPEPSQNRFHNIYADANWKTSVRYQQSSGKDPLSHRVKLDHEYSLCGDSLEPDLPIQIGCIHYYTPNGPAHVGQAGETGVQFRANANTSYRVVFDISAPEGAEIKDHVSLRAKTISQKMDKVRHKCVLEVVSNGEGLVKMGIKSVEAATLYSVKVEEM